MSVPTKGSASADSAYRITDSFTMPDASFGPRVSMRYDPAPRCTSRRPSVLPACPTQSPGPTLRSVKRSAVPSALLAVMLYRPSMSTVSSVRASALAVNSSSVRRKLSTAAATGGTGNNASPNVKARAKRPRRDLPGIRIHEWAIANG